jgi:phosphoenolpyruvate phosphomutase
VLSVESQIAGVAEIFRLQGASELQHAEELYLPHGKTARRAIVLAASRGSALAELTDERPKTMIEIAGRPILQHVVDAYNAAGVKNISVVRGYRKESVNLPNLRYVDNDDYAETSELVSLGMALDVDPDDITDLLVSYGDVLFSPFLLEMIEEPEEPFAIIVDTDWRDSVNRGRAADYVSCTEPYSRHVFQRHILLTAAGERLDESQIHGEWTGLLRVSSAAIPAFRDAVAGLLKTPEGRMAKLHHLLDELVKRGNPIRVLFTNGHWLDVDSLDDLVAASSFR